jgi:hypothetical protein
MADNDAGPPTKKCKRDEGADADAVPTPQEPEEPEVLWVVTLNVFRDDHKPRHDRIMSNRKMSLHRTEAGARERARKLMADWIAEGIFDIDYKAVFPPEIQAMITAFEALWESWPRSYFCWSYSSILDHLGGGWQRWRF